MIQQRVTAIREELCDVEDMPELKAIWCHWQAECWEAANDAECAVMVKDAVRAMRTVPKTTEVFATDPRAKLQGLLNELEELQRGRLVLTQPPVIRANRQYKLLKTEVEWSTKPQVIALMHIISAHAKPGDVLDEGDIVRMVVENEKILQTRQGGKRIWDYYKGDHNLGLVAHGNLERI